MKNYVQAGNSVTITAPTGGVISGSGVLVGHLFGVAAITAAEGEEAEISTNGVFDLAKEAAASMDAGAPAYWDDTNKVVTPTATDNLRVGTAIIHAAGVSATARIMITGHAS